MRMRRLSLFAFSLFVASQQGVAEPPRPSTPTAASAAVREEIDRLASDDAGRRATAAASLGAMGEAAEPAIPWLLAAMADERKVLSISDGDVAVYFVVGKALSRIGAPARRQVTALVTAPGTSAVARRNAARALTMMRDSSSLEALLRASTYAYGNTDPEGHFGDELPRLLVCFPDRRVPDAILQIWKAGRNAGADHTNAFRWAVGGVPETIRTPEAAEEWWAQNRGTASFGKARSDYLCRQ